MNETMPVGADADADAEVPPDPHVEAGHDLRGAVGWTALGVAVLVGSVTMDRLEAQNINPYTIPGLVPGLLGIAMIALGLVLGVRGWRRGGLHAPRPGTVPGLVKRLGLVIGLVVVYAVGLVGHGMPFWLASALYVAASILVLQAPQRSEAGRGLTVRDVAFAVVVGLASGAIVTYVFQELFLVRLP